jgi:hypothetical protein
LNITGVLLTSFVFTFFSSLASVKRENSLDMRFVGSFLTGLNYCN